MHTQPLEEEQPPVEEEQPPEQERQTEQEPPLPSPAEPLQERLSQHKQLSQQERLLGLAHFLTGRLLACPLPDAEALEAVFLTGSVAEGCADTYSDLDFYLVHKSIPTAETITALYRAGGFWGESLMPLPQKGTALLEHTNVGCFYGMVRAELHHVAPSCFETQFNGVHGSECDTKSGAHGFLASLPFAFALHNEAYLARLQAQARFYPPELKEAMVRYHLSRLMPRLGLYGAALRPGDRLSFEERRLTQIEAVLGVLAGVNERYYYAGYHKRRGAWVAGLDFAPVDMAERLQAALEAAPLAACGLLDSLVQEVFGVVKERLWQVDTERAWKRYTVDKILMTLC